MKGNTVRLIAQLPGKGERIADGAGLDEHLRMRNYPDETAKDKLRNRKRRVGVDHSLEPFPIGDVVLRVFPVRIDENIDVEQQHLTIP